MLYHFTDSDGNPDSLYMIPAAQPAVTRHRKALAHHTEAREALLNAWRCNVGAAHLARAANDARNELADAMQNLYAVHDAFEREAQSYADAHL